MLAGTLIMKGFLLQGFTLLGAIALSACSSTAKTEAASSAPPGPAIDAATNGCPSLEVLAAFEADLVLVKGLAVGPDGTLYVSAYGTDFFVGGGEPFHAVYSIPPGGGTPTEVPGTLAARLFLDVDRIWVEGDQLLVTEAGQLYDVPLSGDGGVQQVGGVPRGTADGGDVLLPRRGALLDADALYVTATHRVISRPQATQVWRVPRDGGPAQVLATSSDGTVPWSIGQLASDGTNLYFVVGQGGGLFSVPKTGGSFTLVRPDTSTNLNYDDQLTLVGADFYDNFAPNGLERFGLDPSVARGPIGGAGFAGSIAVDDAGAAYVAITGNSGRDPAWVAVAPMPSGTETVRAIGCSAPFDRLGDAGAPSPVVDTLAVDAQYVYGVWPQTSSRVVVFRVAR